MKPGETPEKAMRREFKEEAGRDLDGWQVFCVLRGRGYIVHFLKRHTDLDLLLNSMTDERVDWFNISAGRALPNDTIRNLEWLIPMALDDELAMVAAYNIS